ncbi:MAG: Phospholipase/carboxylesterase family protein [Labilithrix sp.]|nr:Phospholipase/carboxylesterase family protein [Labilithrix sp.]
MEAQDLGPLRARTMLKTTGTTPKSAGAPPLTVVLLHGFGAPGDDLAGLGSALDVPAGTTFVFPEAPLALSDPSMPFLQDARAWWMIDVGRFERAMHQGKLDELVRDEPAGMAEARAQVDGLLDAIEARTPGTRIVLGGFSQGSMIAMDVAFRSTRKLAGLVVLSGTLLAADVWLPAFASRKGLPVFQSHGTQDPVLPFPIGEAVAQSLTEAGLATTFVPFEGGHGIPPGVLRGLGTWLTSLP